MPVNLSIKNVPDAVVEQLRARAVANRRSLQGELLALVENAAASSQKPRVSLREIYERAVAQGLSGTGSAVDDIRHARKERTRHLEEVFAQSRRRARAKTKVESRGRR